jgi:parallel beta-helix repeat protein
MKNLFSIILLISLSASAQRTYIVAPGGNDANAGTVLAPYKTLQKAWTVVAPGDTIYLRGGTYAINTQQGLTGKNGTATATIKVWAYPGEKPAITRAAGSFSRPYWHRSAIFFTGNYFHFKGIEIYGFPNIDGNIESGFLAYNANNNIFEQLDIHDNHSGFYLEGSCNGNTFLNSDFHDNYDTQGGGGNSDGLATAYMTTKRTTTTIKGCRAWNNGDDGIDNFENQGLVLLENNWTWHNGYVKGTSTGAGDGVGFKLGSVFLATNTLQSTILRKLSNNIAADNRNAGYHSNEGIMLVQMLNNVSYKNGNSGLHFHYGGLPHIFTNNVSLGNGLDVEISGASVSKNNSFGGYSDGGSGWQQTASAADFVSLDITQLARPRKADGSLPDITAFTLAAGSDLINTGLNVGLPFNGTAPDRGAIESGGQVIILPPPPTVNFAPVANAGPDQTITLPTSTVTLNGSGMDIDGTIVSYAWNVMSTTSQSVTLTGLTAGTYAYTLTVTDDKGATGTDTVKVTVNPAPPAPKTVFRQVYVYSDGTVSTAVRQNASKVLISYVRVFTDGTIERIK